MDVMVTTERRSARKARSALSNLDPRLRAYLLDRIGPPTSLQEEAWTDISGGSDVLVISPTGSGKTLAALAVPFDSILKGASDRSGVHVIYITPMKALGYDMLKNLKAVSDHIGPIPSRDRKAGRAKKLIDRSDPIAVEIRTGDVPQSLRRRMLVRPPDVLITTPENLLLMLCSSHRRILSKVRFAVVDEVHEMMRSKRGSMLSLCLEYLRSIVEEGGNGTIQTIGLSATASPREAARFIAGHGPDGRERSISIISGVDDKELTIAIRTLPELVDGGKDIGESVTADINEVLEKTKGSVVVFRNTRSGAEETAHALKALGRDDVAPHHGSLGSDMRARAETGLRSGSLKCIVSSTSLELGIDVGSVGLCLQVSSPGDPTRLVQRFGRAGHGLGRPSEGIIYPLDAVDLLDSYAVSMAALTTSETAKGGIVMPYDVLAQFMVGLSLRDGGTHQKEVLWLARRTSSFHGLRSSDVSAMVSLMTGRMTGKDPPRPRLWFKDGSIHPRKDTRQAFYLNSGTIPREINYRVVEEGTRRVIGELSREFGSSLYEGDVILLGSRSFRVRGFTGPAVRVREDRDAVPTIPRWSGEVPSRPAAVAAEVYRFWADGPPARPVRRKGARSLVLDERSLDVLGRLRNEGVRDGWAPDRSKVPIEVLPRKRGGSIYVFHLPEGRSVTDPLARIVALGIRRVFGARADFVATDEGFAVASPAPILPGDLVSFMDPEGLEEDLREMLYSSSYFDRSFAQCAGRSLLVLSRFRGRDTGALYKRRSLAALSERIKGNGGPRGLTASGPESGLMLIREEAMRETLKDRLDIPRVIGIASSIHSGERAITILPAKKSIGTVGERIVGDWGSDIRSTTSIPGDLGSDALPDGVPILPQTAHTSSAEASAVHLYILSGGPDIPPGSDPLPIVAEAAIHGLSPEDLASDGHLLAVRHEGGVRYYDPRGIPKGADIPAPKRILSWRRRLLRRRSGMRAVTEHVPFFTHPSEIASRARNLGYDDIRSAIMSGRIVAFRAAGGLRVGDPRWALAWDVLSIVSDAARGPDRRPRAGRTWQGHALLPQEMEDMGGPGVPNLSARNTERSKQGDRSFEAERRLLHVLNVLGPMTVSDLTRSFSWDEGPVPIALRALLANGLALSGMGGADPTGSSKELSIWFWSSEWASERTEERRDDADRDDGWSNSTDPFFLLYGRTHDTTAGPRVKGSRGLVFVNVQDGVEAGKAYLSQGGDLVRVHDIEVRDYMDIGRASGSLLGTLDAFSRLGYDLITVEGIMGVPAPEGASAALGALAEGGFSEPVGGERRVLARGFSRIVRITRSEIVASMLKHQCLIDGYHFSHPLEAILRNLSITDRWEVLSRIGASRHGSISADRAKEAMSRVPMRIHDLCVSVTTGEMPDVPSISDLISADREPLPDGRDLMRKLDLERGSLEQPGLVWSARPVLRSYPPSDQSVDLSRSERDLVSYVKLGSERSMEHPGLAERSDEVDDLMRRGVLTVDAWGRHHILRDTRRSRARGSSDPPRGVMLRAFLLSSALSLGIFTFRDIVSLSPGLGPPGRVRTMLSDLCRTHLDRFVTDEPAMEVVYIVKGLDLDRVREDSQIIADEGAVTVISPKDRMARLLSGDFSARLGGVRGYLVLKGAEPAALVGFRRAPRIPVDEHDQRTRGRLLISSVKRGHFWRADALVREVRRRMFEMGFDTVTEADLEKERTLYRGP